MVKPLYLDEAGHTLVSNAVAAAEAHTSGEIVTILADQSDTYNDVALAWAAIAAFAAMAIIALFPNFYLARIDWLLGHDWGHEWTGGQMINLALAVGTLKFISVALILQIPAVKNFFIPGPIKSARVHDQAVRFFKVGAERRTHGSTGILIYLSTREHRAEIVADQAIAEKVSPEMWGAAMEAMLAQIAQGRIAEGMVAAVDSVGILLAQHFPRDEEDTNELPDRLIEI